MASLVVLTGAPGSGKTAILSRLRETIRCVDEPAREVLAEQRASGGEGTPERDPARFVELLLQRSMESHAAALREGVSTLFDRGVPDCIAYAEYLGTDPEPSILAAAEHRYQREVLWLTPWKEIYTTDDERKMTFEATLKFGRLLERAYDSAGYTLVEVPRAPLERRVSFVREFTERNLP